MPIQPPSGLRARRPGRSPRIPTVRPSRMAFHLGWRLALVVALCLTLGGIADSEGARLTGQRVQLATADQTEATARVVAGLRKRFPAAEVSSALSPEAAQGGNAAVIAIGPAALSAVLARGTNGVIVSVFTSSEAYREIVKGIPESKRAMVTAVHADPSLPDQLGLISAIYKRRVRVGVLLSQRTAYLLPQLTRSAEERDLELSVESVSVNRSLNESLNRLAHAAVILAVPDKAIYHAENIRNILLTTYRRMQPLIGFSNAFVKAGALA